MRLLGYSPWDLKESDTTERLHSLHSLRSLRSLHSLSLEKEMATHSSILAWRIPWTEEPGGPWSMGSQRVGHTTSDSALSTSLVFLSGGSSLAVVCRFLIAAASLLAERRLSGSQGFSIWGMWAQ